MNSEIILKKSAFGGFTKESVFELVEKLQNENLKLKNEIENMKNDTSVSDNYEKIIAEKNEIIVELENKNREMLEANASYLLKIEESKANCEELENRLEECKSRLSQIEQGFNAIQEKYDKYGDAEKYQAETKKKADGVVQAVRELLESSIGKISQRNDELKISNDNFAELSSKIISEADALIKSINDISSELESRE